MLDDSFFKQKKIKIKQKMKNEINILRYWKKFAKECKNNRKKNIQTFKREFPHINGLDDESKIEAYAAEFGYEVTGEIIKADKSIYTFSYKNTLE